MMIDGVMLLWFGLTALSVAFVAVDIRTTPDDATLKPRAYSSVRWASVGSAIAVPIAAPARMPMPSPATPVHPAATAGSPGHAATAMTGETSDAHGAKQMYGLR